MRNVCAVLNCKYSQNQDSSKAIFTNFPNDDTAREWAAFCGRSDLATKSNAELHSNYYMCSYHIAEYISKPFSTVIGKDTVPFLFESDLSTDTKDSRSIFDKSQHFQEESLMCNVKIERDEYHDTTISLSNLCRICGASTLDGIRIFSAKGIELKLQEKISLHTPVSIDIEDLMPQKVCADCCNKLEVTHSLVVSCLKTDMRLKRFLNTKRKLKYENKYNALVDECLFEIAQEMCEDKLSHTDITCLRDFKNGEHSKIQSNNCESIARNVSSKQNTANETCRGVRNNESVTEEISQIQQDKVLDGSQSILLLHCPTVCEMQEVSENHSIFYDDVDNIAKCITRSKAVEIRKYKNKQVNLEESSETCNEGLESNEVIDKSIVSESLHCAVCDKVFICYEDYNIHKSRLGEFLQNKRCGHCKKPFHNKDDLLNHFTESHNGLMCFMCSTCDKAYPNLSSLYVHESFHNAFCDICGTHFRNSNTLSKHRKRMHGDFTETSEKCNNLQVNLKESSQTNNKELESNQGTNKFKLCKLHCTVCNKVFKCQQVYDNHQYFHGNLTGTRKKRGRVNLSKQLNLKESSQTSRKGLENNQVTDKSLHCTVCNKIFKYQQIYDNHQCFHRDLTETSKKRGQVNLKESSQTSKKRLKNNQVTDKLLHCAVCNKTFKSQRNCNNHKCLYDNPNKTSKKCGHCKNIYPQTKDLLNHFIESHDRILLFECSTCGKTYKSLSNFYAHEKAHRVIEKKIYICDICDSAYYKKYDLQQHMNLHLDNKPYLCEQCGKTFHKGSHLYHHKFSHSSETHVCPICCATYKRKVHLNVHMKWHKKGAHKCNICAYKFKSSSELRIHKRIHLAEEIENKCNNKEIRQCNV